MFTDCFDPIVRDDFTNVQFWTLFVSGSDKPKLWVFKSFFKIFRECVLENASEKLRLKRSTNMIHVSIYNEYFFLYLKISLISFYWCVYHLSRIAVFYLKHSFICGIIPFDNSSSYCTLLFIFFLLIFLLFFFFCSHNILKNNIFSYSWPLQKFNFQCVSCDNTVFTEDILLFLTSKTAQIQKLYFQKS